MSKSILLAFPAFAAAAALSTPTAGDFVRELRGAKTALLRGVAAEGGALSEDALALMDGLGRVNPSAPNPAADVDLWANDYDVRSRLPLPTPPGWDGWDAATEAPVVRLRRDEAEFEAGVHLAGDPELRGRLRFAGALSVPAGSRTALEWRPTELELEFDDGSDAAAAACNALGGILPDDVFKAQIAFDDGSGSAITKMSASWQRAQSELVVGIELTYLDQDMILCMLPALGDARVVLERRRESESE